MVEFNLLKPIIRKFIPQVREYCASGKLDEVIREFKPVEGTTASSAMRS